MCSEEKKSLVEAIGRYLRERFWRELSEASGFQTVPREFSLELLKDCNHAAKVMVMAFNNQRRTSWKAEDYMTRLTPGCKGRNEKTEASLQCEFPPLMLLGEVQTEPMMIVDADGNGLLWYLPEVLRERRAAEAFKCLSEIEPLLKTSKTSTSWRINKTHFRGEEGWLKPGCVSFSPAWHQQGHEKSDPLVVGQYCRTVAGRRWLRSMEEINGLMSALMSVAQPELFAAGMKLMSKLRGMSAEVQHGECLDDLIPDWGNIFNVISIISNRITPAHRDTGSALQWLDILLAIGRYGDGYAEFSGLGIGVRYRPGTVVMNLGRIVRHAAECNGDRACIAYYMREAVWDAVGGIQKPGWPRVGKDGQ